MYGDDQRRWTNVINFAEIVSGKTPGRTNDQQITLFKSNGIAIEDIVVAGRIYEIAKEKRMGRQLTLWEKSEQSRDARAV
jgi:ornithine cyclodeaminase/alanine dehydrogenase-like protein (mu-crystallin family)